MENNNKEILERLKRLGFIVDDSVTHNLTITLTDVVNFLLDDEIKLLDEFESLHKKKISGGNLSYLEESFYNQVAKSYVKK
ncbi:hypothetical protein IMCC3317_40680 [Kordia antarctica]|uniref:Uncharacterized protein n=1 Tax=Kordia antarctica TaxID=1218801 RepID=A0A7L4ZSB1_9FLAO|nr:hypothetical protein [Kordia antarctica]QHI38674.1 hypothetical protein IMCC3317_40680 [Kordia antarctica]